MSKTDIDTVYMTRTDDIHQVGSTQRTDYANSIGAAWYHSIHSDAEAPPANSTLLLWGQYYDRREKIPNGGKAMADVIVGVLTDGMRVNSRGSIGDCTFYSASSFCAESGGPYLFVNRLTTMPSELSEAGSHTNPMQDQLFMNDEYKRYEGYLLYWPILDFHEIERAYDGVCAGIIENPESEVPINGAKVTINGRTYVTDTYESLFSKYSSDPNKLHNGFYFFENLPKEKLKMTVEVEGYYKDSSEVTMDETFVTFNDMPLISKEHPYVVLTVPAAGDTNYPAWNNVSVTFSRPMDRNSVESSLSISPEAEHTYSWTNKDQKIAIIVDSLEFETVYTVTVRGQAKDKYDHPFDGNHDGIGPDDFSFSFKTGPADMFPPDIVSYYPPRNEKIIGLQPVVSVEYNEKIDSTSITEGIFKLERQADESAVPGTLQHYIVSERSVLCYFPAEKLFPEERYFIRIYPGLRDFFSNEVTIDRASNFKTTNGDYEITTLDNFDENATSNWWNPQQSGSTEGIITEKTGREADTKIVNLLTGSTTSLKLNYGFDTSAPSQLIRMYLGSGTPRNRTFTSDAVLQVYVFGDGNGNLFRFAIDDNYPSTDAQYHEVSPWYTIDWIGWRLVTWDMTADGTGEWLGNGVYDGRLRFDSIQMTYNPGSPVSGTVYFDDLQWSMVKYIGIADQPESSIPHKFTLRQNYPNPFNPFTTIKYNLPDGSHQVKLVIYDILGKKVRTLVNKTQPAGEYSIQWDAKDEGGQLVASGMYLYKLSADDFTEMKRMVLIR